MKFTIENGENLCSIGITECGSYFRFNDPLTVVFERATGTPGGSLHYLFSNLPYDKDYRDAVHEKITGNLYVDFTQNIEGLFDILTPLFPIFKNGEYDLSFHFKEGERSIKSCYSGYRNGVQDVRFSDMMTYDLSDEDKQIQHKKNLKLFEVEDYSRFSILPYTIWAEYEKMDSFYATQTYESIDQERVKYFEEQLKRGERPLAIIMTARRGDYESAYYILDGHHKLLAYQKLNIHPPIALFTYLPVFDGPGVISEKEFDIELLAKVLYPWHTKDVLLNYAAYGGRRKRLVNIMKNSYGPLHQLIRNKNAEE